MRLSNGGDPLCERWLNRPPLSHAILSTYLHNTKQNKKVKGLEMGLYQVVALGEKQQVHLRVARRMGGREKRERMGQQRVSEAQELRNCTAAPKTPLQWERDDHSERAIRLVENMS